MDLKFDFFFVFVKEMKLCHMVVIIRLDAEGLFVFSAPMGSFAEKPATFCQIGVHDRVNRQDQVFVLVIQ